MVRAGSGERVWFAGEEGPAYEEIVDAELSPDGQRLAYVARKGGRLVVVDHGRESPGYQEIGELRFSPDGSRLVYRAKKGTGGRGGGWVMVVDGREGKEYADIDDESPVFGPDGRTLAYIARHHAHRALGWRLFEGLWIVERVPSVVVVNEHEGPRLDNLKDESITFSPDGRRVAYIGQLHDYDWKVFLDGNPGRGYTSVRDLVFSPNGRRIAYWAQRAGQGEVLVVDNDEYPRPEYIVTRPEAPVFSADGRRVAYVAHMPNYLLTGIGKSTLVVDGQKTAEAERIANVRFTSDNEVTYLMRTGRTWYRVVGDERNQLVPGEDQPPTEGLFSQIHRDGPLESLARDISIYVSKPTLSGLLRRRGPKGRLPPLDTPAALADALRGNTRGVSPFWYWSELVDPDNGSLFATNPSVSRKRLSELGDLSRVVLVYESSPGRDGLRRALFADGRVQSLSETRWTVLKARNGIP